MAKLHINIGDTANDRTGDPLRTAFDKVNQNFDELYANSSTSNELVNGSYNFTLGVDGTINFDPSTNGNGVLQTTTNLQFTADTKTWLFGGEDGILTLPAGGDIVDSTGTSVLGGGGASLGDFSITTRTIASTTQGNVILRALGSGGAPSDPPIEYNWTFTNGGRLQMPAGGDIVDSTGTSVLSGSNLKTIQTVSTTGSTVTITGNVVFADPNAAGGIVQLLLPQQPPAGTEVTVKNINTSTFAVYISASNDASVPIETEFGLVSSSAYGSLTTTGDVITWMFDGTAWRIIGGMRTIDW